MKTNFKKLTFAIFIFFISAILFSELDYMIAYDVSEKYQKILNTYNNNLKKCSDIQIKVFKTNPFRSIRVSGDKIYIPFDVNDQKIKKLADILISRNLYDTDSFFYFDTISKKQLVRNNNQSGCGYSEFKSSSRYFISFVEFSQK